MQCCFHAPAPSLLTFTQFFLLLAVLVSMAFRLCCPIPWSESSDWQHCCLLLDCLMALSFETMWDQYSRPSLDRWPRRNVLPRRPRAGHHARFHSSESWQTSPPGPSSYTTVHSAVRLWIYWNNDQKSNKWVKHTIRISFTQFIHHFSREIIRKLTCFASGTGSADRL